MSDWREIIKAKGKLTSTPKLDLDIRPTPKRPKDNSCNKKLEEYFKMLSERPSLFEDLDILSPEEYELGEGYPYFGATYRVTKNESSVLEKIAFKYEPIPEEVACKALSYFENSDITDDIQYRNFKDKNSKSWKIGWRVEDVFDDALADEDNYFADISVMLVVYELNSELQHSIHLSHRIILNKELTEKEEDSITEKLDWR
tara:strand:- start:1161 stop:1763 length:603 start_codon:yes stop_codon:yes gene_type:complete